VTLGTAHPKCVACKEVGKQVKEKHKDGIVLSKQRIKLPFACEPEFCTTYIPEGSSLDVISHQDAEMRAVGHHYLTFSVDLNEHMKAKKNFARPSAERFVQDSDEEDDDEEEERSMDADL
jgi:hypothetical protein